MHEHETSSTDTPAHMAGLIRSAAAWWTAAAGALEQGDTVQAARFARCGEFGLEHAVARIVALTGADAAVGR
ncbi:MAG: hypothetical protein JJT89_17165 [Nitriliruptoraceae bacterium]|nr:hypothetical protein [Nitriliruptoraceae bacterium]